MSDNGWAQWRTNDFFIGICLRPERVIWLVQTIALFSDIAEILLDISTQEHICCLIDENVDLSVVVADVKAAGILDVLFVEYLVRGRR